MKKSVIIGIIIVILIIAGVNLIGSKENNNKDIDMMSLINQKNNKVTYVDFSYEGISFKVPEEWNIEEVDNRLKTIMENIFTSIYTISNKYKIKSNDLLTGANILAFEKLITALDYQGI